jgi:general secretion pathway protein E
MDAPAAGAGPTAGDIDALAAPRELTLEVVLDALEAGGLLSREDRRIIEVREPLLRSRVQRARIGKPGDKAQGASARARYAVGPVEIVAAAALKRADRPEEGLDEDAATRVVAQRLGIPYVKLDPLKLDAELITTTMSRPFARRHVVLPIAQKESVLEVAVADPFDVELLEGLKRITGRAIAPVLSSKSDILGIITEVYGFRRSVAAAERDLAPPLGADIGNLEQLIRLKDVEEIEATDQHVINAVEYVIHYALGQRASDIHLEPRREKGRIRLRIDGVLHDIYTVPRRVQTAFVSRLKVMSRLDIAERRRPQDGRFKTAQNGREVELRINIVPTAFGEKAVVRIFDPDAMLRDVGEIGFFPRELGLFETFIGQPHGMVLVTGPTGSGKTTTLYAALRAIATPEVNVTTIEDPIEMVVEDFNQIAVNRAIDLTFANALRAVLRQDPDIIMVGEIRDPETAQMAVQSALTGHLVLSTLHTNDTASSITRLMDLGVPPFLIASTLTGVVAQRLVRKVCPRCRVEVPLTSDQIAALDIKLPEGPQRHLPVMVGEGCVTCRGTGLYGRTGVMEVLPVTPRMRKAIAEARGAADIQREARADGMMTLRECGIKKLALGTTSYDEVLRATADQTR